MTSAASVSLTPIDLTVRTEVDETATWWRSVLLANYAMPMPQYDGDAVGMEHHQHIIWTSPWRQTNHNPEDLVAGERAVISEAVNRLATVLAHQITEDQP
jgi:hypothetical protein